MFLLEEREAENWWAEKEFKTEAEEFMERTSLKKKGSSAFRRGKREKDAKGATYVR